MILGVGRFVVAEVNVPRYKKSYATCATRYFSSLASQGGTVYLLMYIPAQTLVVWATRPLGLTQQLYS